MPDEEGKFPLGEPAAAAVARVALALRGPGAPFTTATECRLLSAALMADLHEVPIIGFLLSSKAFCLWAIR